MRACRRECLDEMSWGEGGESGKKGRRRRVRDKRQGDEEGTRRQRRDEQVCDAGRTTKGECNEKYEARGYQCVGTKTKELGERGGV